jgi:type VI secretion system protein ImpA
MTIVDDALLATPLSREDPCGPDLDAAGDAAYVNFFAAAQYRLPESFFQDGQPFDPANEAFRANTADFPRELAALLRRTRDLRLLVLLARFASLKRDMDAVAAALGAIAELLDAYWDAVHPRAENGSFAARAQTLSELDDPTLVFSLQFVTLLADRRRGAIAYRSIALAKAVESGELAEISGGRIAPLGEAPIAQAFTDAGESALAQRRAEFTRISQSIERIKALLREKSAGVEMLTLPRLDAVLRGVTRLFDLAFAPEQTVDAQTDDADASSPTPGVIGDASNARRALECARDYFRRNEPSSPALPLVAHALELQGKSFTEILETLTPDHYSAAHYAIGEQNFFKLAIRRLREHTPDGDGYFDPPAAAAAATMTTAAATPQTHQESTHSEYVASAEAPTSDSPSYADTTPDAASEAPTSPETPAEEIAAAAETRSQTIALGEIETIAPLTVLAPPILPARADPKPFTATTRAQALRLLNDVGAYFRGAEPSSPIPWLTDRARALAEKDFISLLAAVLPKGTLDAPQ